MSIEMPTAHTNCPHYFPRRAAENNGGGVVHSACGFYRHGHSPCPSEPISMEKSLTGELDAGNPPVRFGERIPQNKFWRINPMNGLFDSPSPLEGEGAGVRGENIQTVLLCLSGRK